ncbi:MAG: hypothetical protein FJ319_07890 [SAR202 cluster bacterium]|nr:hypothetical protein [SAR202 cluster bacterium]
MHRFDRNFAFALLAALAVASIALTACGQRSTPLLRQGTVLPSTPLPGSNATPIPLITGTPLSNDIVGKGTIRFANHGENRIALESTLVGYFMVWGYGYSAELIDTKEAGNKAAFDQGLVDVVMEVDRVTDAEWYNSGISSGKIVDAGSLLGASSDKRIVVQPALRQSSPELVSFLGSVTLDDATIANYAASITTGRVGVSPTVATLTYLKSGTTWSTWAPQDIIAGVTDAISTGKTSLRNRGCIPIGNEGGATTMRCIQ